ncbi:MAG: hypothetical protein LH474_13415 [Chamaesiphon sp.]|nr:hypothetical protein [Chamaesiphon sp.]
MTKTDPDSVVAADDRLARILLAFFGLLTNLTFCVTSGFNKNDLLTFEYNSSQRTEFI